MICMSLVTEKSPHGNMEDLEAHLVIYFLPYLKWWFLVLSFFVTHTVNNLSAMWETWLRPLGGEDPLEKGMATHSSVLAWRIPWTEEPGGLQSMQFQRVAHTFFSSPYVN